MKVTLFVAVVACVVSATACGTSSLTGDGVAECPDGPSSTQCWSFEVTGAVTYSWQWTVDLGLLGQTCSQFASTGYQGRFPIFLSNDGPPEIKIDGGVDYYDGPGTSNEGMTFSYSELGDAAAESARVFSTGVLGAPDSTITIDPSGSGSFRAERLNDDSGASISITGRWTCRD